MTFGQTPVTTSQSALATNQIPLGEVYVPNHAGGNATALQGGPASTDGLGNESAPVATYTPDGNDVTQGTSTDPNTANTVIGRLTKIRDLLLATLVVSGTITEANSAAINTHLANIDTNTNKIPASPATEGGNLASILTQVANHAVTQGAGAAAGTNWRVGPDFVEYSGLSVTTNGNYLLASTDMSGYQSGSVTVSGVWTGTLSIQFCNTNVVADFQTVNYINVTSLTGTSNAITANNTYNFPKYGRYCRIKATAAMTGTANGVVEFFTFPVTLLSTAAQEAGSWTVQPGNTANSTPWLINNQQVAGTTTSVNAGTSDAGTQRVIQAGAATGTKTNVASSASSVTILASNTSRKGAMIYNDSTQILYLDLTGGTASSTSYSLQMPANSMFEVPGPTIYNGAITGIWAAANGNARVSEFS